MKKLLLASTALVMTAGVAAADVAVTGNARMGFLYDGNDVKFTSRSRVIFTMSGETDGGLAFGASFRADQAGDANNAGGNFDMQGGSVFVSGEFGRLTMGDVSGAAEYIVGDLDGVGLTGLNDRNENAYLSNAAAANRTAARYQYELDGLKLAISADQPTSANNAYSIGVGYEFDGFGAGVGYEKISGGNSHAIAYASASFSGVNAKATYGRQTGSQDQYGLSVSSTFDATTVTAFARRDFNDNTHYGIGASYDLGGGASIVGGIVRDGGLPATATDPAVPQQTIADFGLSFTF